MGNILSEFIGGIIAASIFTIWPAYMLYEKYGLAESIAFASISATLMSIFWSINKIVEKSENK